MDDNPFAINDDDEDIYMKDPKLIPDPVQYTNRQDTTPEQKVKDEYN